MTTRSRSKLESLWLAAVFVCCVLAGGGTLAAQRVVVAAAAAPESMSDVNTGAVPASQMMSLTVRLKPDAGRAAALGELIAGQMTAGSASYRQWITANEFGRQFGATDAQIASVTAWLEAQGLTVAGASASKLRLTVTGSSAQVAAAFKVQLRQYRGVSAQGAAVSYFANAGAASVPEEVGDSVAGVAGLDDRPVAKSIVVTPVGAEVGSRSSLEELVDENAAAGLIVTSDACFTDVSAADVSAYQSVLRQAEAQGLTVLATSECGAQSFPAGLAEVTAVAALASETTKAAQAMAQDGGSAGSEVGGDPSGTVQRPEWQFAQGLPENGLRMTPDVSADVKALARTLAAISAQAGTRLGNVAPVLYALAEDPGLLTQPDGAAAGSWETTTGLGLVDLKQLAKDFPRGTIGSSSLLVPSSFAPAHGGPLTLTATVTSTGGSGVPTGMVTFTSTQKGTLGTAALNGTGVATLTTNLLVGGTYTTTSVYGGDATYTGSTSGVATITVVGEVSVITATVAPGAAVGGSASVAVSVTSASGVGTPSGTVTVSPQGTKNTATASASIAGTSGTASGTVLLPVYEAGEFTLLVSCTDADPSFTCNSPIAVQMTVGKGSTTTTIAGTPTDPAAGGAYTLTATVAGSSTATTTGSATGTIVGVRRRAVTANVPAATASMHAADAPAAGGPTGNVQFMDGTTYLATAAIANGVATYSGTATTATHSFNAMYSGDQNYGTSSSTTQATTAGLTPTSTSLTASSYAVSIGQTVTFYSTVFSIGVASTQTGTVTYSAATQGVLGSGTVSGGLATLTLATLPAGTYVMTATYSGDTVFAGSASTSSVIVTVAAGAATLAGSFNPATVPYGSDAVLTATASFAATFLGGPAGTLVATIAGVTGATYTQTLLASSTSPTSVAVFTFPAPPPGIYTVTVSCPAADTFSCAGPATIPFTVTRGKTTMALTLTPQGPLAGQPVTMTATIGNAGDDTRAYTFTGTVQFFANNQLLGSAAVNGVTASISAALPAGSEESITAVYSGDVDWTTSLSTPVVITVAALPTTIVVTSNVTNALSGVQVELTATVTNVAGGPLATTAPTGSVSFYDTYNGVVSSLGTAKLVSQGANTSIATLNATALSTGTHSVYAVYLGDTIYLGSTSPAIMLGLTNYAVTFVPTTMTVTQGQSGAATLVVNFQGGFGGSVSFGCTPPPNIELTCSFSPAVLTASGTTTLNVGTVVAQNDKRSGQSSDARQHGGYGGRVAGGAAMGMLLLCTRRKRLLPGLLLALLAVVSLGAMGCSGTNVNSTGTPTTPPVTTPTTPGTSLGTQILTITTAGSDGTNTVRHDFQYQVTVQ